MASYWNGSFIAFLSQFTVRLFLPVFLFDFVSVCTGVCFRKLILKWMYMRDCFSVNSFILLTSQNRGEAASFAGASEGAFCAGRCGRRDSRTSSSTPRSCRQIAERGGCGDDENGDQIGQHGRFTRRLRRRRTWRKQSGERGRLTHRVSTTLHWDSLNLRVKSRLSSQCDNAQWETVEHYMIRDSFSSCTPQAST